MRIGTEHQKSLGRRIKRDERGFALAAATVVLLVLLTFAFAGTVYSTLDLRSTSHYDTGNQALAAAESGILHALSTMNNTGVINFQDDVVQHWSTLFGTASKSMTGYSSITYQVSVVADAASPSQKGTMTATGYAPNNAKRVIQVGIKRGNFDGSRGAIYLAADTVSSQFTGNAFDVDGNDHTTSGANNPSGPVVPGISTRNDTVTDAITSSLSDEQKDNVQGQGFSSSPLTPSVLTTGGPSVDDLDQIALDFLSRPGVVTDSSSSFNGDQTLGTVASPQITHMTNSDVSVNGNLTGAGVIIADGSITINGTMDFVGWIMVRGDTTINVTGDASDDTQVLGNATIYGSLWTADLHIKIGGSAIVGYCYACMQLVDGIDVDGASPRPMNITSWQEVL